MNLTQIQKIQKILDRHSAYLVVLPPELFYLTGFEITGYFLFILKSEVVFLSSPMTEFQLKDTFKTFQIISSANLDLAYKNSLKKFNIKKVYYSPQISMATYKTIKKYSLCVENDLLSRLRAVKSDYEIKIMRENQKITRQAILYAKKFLKKGVTEKFIQKKIYEYLLKNNASAAFEPIVAFGKNSAYPHHISGHTRLKSNDIVLIDAGCRRKGYCSDLTKTFFLGKISPRAMAVYDIVKKSQQRAIDLVSAGKSCREVDSLLRDYIKKSGYQNNFTHGLGHGVGLEVHEKPSLSQTSKDKLTEGMVITVEPAIYIAGEFGVRIEDMVVVKKDNCEVL